MAASQQVVIRLVGENDQLRKSLQDSQRQIKRLEKQVAGIKKSGAGSFGPIAKSAGAAAGATIAAGRAFDFLKGSVKTTTELTKASVKLSNVTGADVKTSAQLVQLTKARGVSTQQLTTGFVALSKQIQGAQSGSKKAVAAFDALGVSQKTLASGDTTEVLKAVSDGLAGVQNPAERAALAQQLLGRSGKDLLGVLKGGSKALEEQMGVYAGSSAEIAANKDNVLKLAGDQRKLNAAVESVRVSLGVALIPVLEKVTAVLTRFSQLSPGMKKAIMTLVGIGAAVVAINKVKNAMIALRLVMLANPFTAVATVAVAAAVLIWQNWDRIKKWLSRAWGVLKTKFVELGNTIRSWAKRGFLGPVPAIIANWGRIVAFFKALPGKLGGAARRAAGAIGNGFKRGGGAIIAYYKRVMNGLIGVIEAAINAPIRGINRLIDVANRLKPGKDIGKIGRIDLPQLAEGGIVAKPTVALIGEAGPEAVVPLTGRNARKAGIAGGGNNNYFTINTTGPVDEVALARSIGWQLQTRGLA